MSWCQSKLQKFVAIDSIDPGSERRHQSSWAIGIHRWRCVSFNTRIKIRKWATDVKTKNVSWLFCGYGFHASREFLGIFFTRNTRDQTQRNGTGSVGKSPKKSGSATCVACRRHSSVFFNGRWSSKIINNGWHCTLYTVQAEDMNHEYLDTVFQPTCNSWETNSTDRTAFGSNWWPLNGSKWKIAPATDEGFIWFGELTCNLLSDYDAMFVSMEWHGVYESIPLEIQIVLMEHLAPRM